MSDLEEAIRAASELRALLREAHGTIKDLRREVKEARGAIDADLKRAPQEVGDLVAGIGGMCSDLLADWAERLGKKCPLTMMCPGCGIILAVLSGDGEECRCSGCGKRFRTQSFVAG